MTLYFRTTRFDASSDKDDDRFYGEDAAKWLVSRLDGWETDITEEDWGWAVTARKNDYRYIFGVYDLDTGDTNDQGSRWCLRLFNLQDKTPWYRKLFRHVHPVADAEVVQEIETILSNEPGFVDIQQGDLT
jgi:hypothetical protein